MLMVNGEKITFQYESQGFELLKNIDFKIDSHSRIGIVGKNGSGKSTLLKLIFGELAPLKGIIQNPFIGEIGFLKQTYLQTKLGSTDDFIWSHRPILQALRREISSSTLSKNWLAFSEYEERGGYQFEIEIEKKLALFSLDEKILSQPFDSLSTGEKTKIGLINILLQKPKILVLDEPTNNLDKVSLDWLLDFLRSIKIPYLVVSHDRNLLNKCVNEIWNLSNSSLTTHAGHYESFADTQSKNILSSMEKYQQQIQKISKLKQSADRLRIDAKKMDRFKQSRSIKNNGGVCQKDVGSGSARANPNKKMRSAKSAEKRIQRTIEKELAAKPWIDKQRHIHFPVNKPLPNMQILNIDGVKFDYGDKNIFTNFKLNITSGSKSALSGVNGCGKSTFIKLLTGYLYPKEGSIHWSKTVEKCAFFQDQFDLRDDDTVLTNVWNPDIVDQSTVRLVLGSLGIDSIQISQKVETLSSGERVKVALAKTILSGANVLILDEPTNHLDLPAREMLENALKEYKGTLIFVSHDTEFVKKVATDIIEIQGGK